MVEPVGLALWKMPLRTFMNAFGGGGGGDSMFDSFFGGGGGDSGARQGASKKVGITISFEDAAKGVEKEIAIQNFVSCDSCQDRAPAPMREFRLVQAVKDKDRSIKVADFLAWQQLVINVTDRVKSSQIHALNAMVKVV